MAQEGLDELIEREWAAVLAVAIALVGRDGVAEELTQEGFLAAHRHWEHVRSLDRPGAWVRRVVVNRSISHLRRRRVERRVLELVGRDPLRRVAEEVAGGVDGRDELVWAEVRRLPTRQAQCIVLRHVDGRSAAEIGEILGCAEPTVRVHLHRGLTTLRSRLEPARGGSGAAIEANG